MYRRALRTPSPALRSPAFYTTTSRTTTLCYRPSLNALSRCYSTPAHPPHDKQVQPPPAQTLSSPDDPPDVQSKATAGPPQGESQAGTSGTNADQLDEVKARVKEWSHDAVQSMRQRGDEFTARVARTFAQLGSELNRVTGYGEIEALKRKVVEQEARIYNAREAARQAKDAYDTAVLQRAKSQREVNDLLQRKSHWTDEDVSRFTTLVREDHAREHDESRAKAAAAAAEDAVEREFSELMRVILNRYHEEQAWSDKIRSASTYGSLAALALNMAVFVLAIVLVEPWKRRRLAQTFERKVEEMSAQTEAAFRETTDALAGRMDEQARMLSAVLETVHLATHVSPAEQAEVEAEVRAERTRTELPEDGERIRAVPRTEKEMLLAVGASAAAAGVLGWLARSWYG
ncbi:Mdm33 family-domain-containing protein [Earliella scabrosa]|nr:Mdm33 family-domain-containing protein [Earliella scabrosa]